MSERELPHASELRLESDTRAREIAHGYITDAIFRAQELGHTNVTLQNDRVPGWVMLSEAKELIEKGYEVDCRDEYAEAPFFHVRW